MSPAGARACLSLLKLAAIGFVLAAFGAFLGAAAAIATIVYGWFF